MNIWLNDIWKDYLWACEMFNFSHFKPLALWSFTWALKGTPWHLVFGGFNRPFVSLKIFLVKLGFITETICKFMLHLTEMSVFAFALNWA